MSDSYTPEEAKSAIDNLGVAVKDFKSANDKVLDEVKKNGEASAAAEEKLAKVEERLVAAEDAKTRLEQIEVAMKKMRTSSTPNGDKSAQLNEAQLAHKEAYGAWLRKGTEGDLDALQQKALAVQNDPDGGYFVDADTTGRIVTRIFETSPLRNIANVQTISSDALEGMVDDDEAGATWTGETEAPTDEKTPKVGKYRIPAHEMSTEPSITQKLLDDANFNVEQWLADKVSRRFSRSENLAFVLGDGAEQPKGFLTYPASADADVYERKTIGQLDTDAIGDIGFDDIIDLNYLLKAEYRAMATWVFNRRTFGAIRKLKDDQGQYLWESNLQIGQPASILGRPIQELNDMPDIAANSLSVGFGAFNDAYQIVDRMGIRQLRDPFTNKPYVKIYTTKRTGGDVVNFDALKLLHTLAA